MKIAFVGKGGSGKTTISALVSRYLAERGFPVLAIDADINQHLGKTLGLSEADAAQVPPMGIEIERIKEYVRGTNTRIPSVSSMLKTTPPGTGSRFLRIAEANPVFEHFVRKAGAVSLMAVGAFTEDDLGVRCYHSKTGAVELLLNHCIDKAQEYIIVDMTAGADAFASGLFTRFDITFLVVEPTLKSLSVYTQYKHYAREHDIAIRVIGNKVETEEDTDFIRAHVGDDLVALFVRSEFVRKTDRGAHVPLAELEEDNTLALGCISDAIDTQKKDWEKFYRQAVEFHIRNAESWANAAAGEDLTKHIDPNFDLAATVASM